MTTERDPARPDPHRAARSSAADRHRSSREAQRLHAEALQRARRGVFADSKRMRNSRCGVLYAEGDHFTAGLDMPTIVPLRREGKPLLPTSEVDPFNLRPPLRTKPVVAAMKGICFTVAIELMLASDIVIAADNCRFSQLEVKRGIMAGCGATFRMVERAGWGNAMKYLLTGDEFDAREALRMNFVQEVVPVGQELPRALELAERICRQAPLAVQATMENARVSQARTDGRPRTCRSPRRRDGCTTPRMRRKACSRSSRSATRALRAAERVRSRDVPVPESPSCSVSDTRSCKVACVGPRAPNWRPPSRTPAASDSSRRTRNPPLRTLPQRSARREPSRTVRSA